MTLDSIAGRLMVIYSTRTAAIVAAAIVAIGGAAAPVSAQDSAQNDTAEQLLACDGMTDPAERQACINDLVEGLKQSPVVPADSSPPASASHPVSPAAADTIAIATVPAAVVNTPPPTGSPAAPTVTSDGVVDDIGRESVNDAESAQQKNQEKKTDSELIQATIVRSWENRDYRFVVQLDNGEVWQQTDGYRVNRPKAGGSVEISKRRFGGYRMKIDKEDKLIGVRQTK